MKTSFIISKIVIVLIGLLSMSGEVKAQPHCKLGWQVQPYFCDMDSLILTAYAFGGAEPYSYLWSTGETTVSIYAFNSPGYSYSVTITGENGCTASGTYNMGVNVDPYINASTTVSCQNFPIYLDAVFLFLVVPPPGVTYLWSTGATTHNITVLDPGTYSVTFTDPANGCTFTASQTVSFLPAPDPIITGSTQLCGGQSTTLTASGGPFNEYLWLPGLQSTESITVNTPGTYIVQVQGSNFCYGYDTVTVTNGANITLSGLTTPYTSCSNPNGAIDLSVNPSGSYTYTWSNNATTQDISNLIPGTYSVTVTAAGCELTSSFTIPDNTTAPSPALTSVASSCGQSNGSVTLINSPPGSYTYNWSNGATTQNLTNVPGGNYSVTVTNSNGCTATTSTTVTNNDFTPTLTGTSTPVNSCISANGTINITVSPAGIYTYTWSNGSTLEDLSNLVAGTYSVTVTSGITCTSTASFVVDNAAINPIVQGTSTPSSCGQNNGAINLQVNGGQSPYAYLWSNGSTADALTNISAGLYSVTVTASNGCQTVEMIELLNVDPVINIDGIVIPNTSCGQGNGEIDISLIPSGSYTYNWSNGATTADITNLSAGTYTVTVTFDAGCTQTMSFAVANTNIPFDISGITVQNSSCTTPNGSIDIQINPAGTYTYQWSSGQSTQNVQNLNEGVYIITVTNVDGCALSSSFTIQSTLPVISLSGTITDNTSCSNPNGNLDLTVTPAGNYTYQWSTGVTTEDLQFLSAGTYSVTVSDLNSCSSNATFTLSSLTTDPVISSIITEEICSAGNGSIDLSVSPPGNSYLWSNGTTTEDLFNLEAGSYQVTVTTVNGCMTMDTFEILNTSNTFMVTGISTDNTSCINPNGSINLDVLPVGNYQYQWSTGDTIEDLSLLAAGLYTVTVSDQSNCISTYSFTIQGITPNPELTEIIQSATCGQANGSIDLSIVPSTGNTYNWSNGAMTEDLIEILAGSYEVTVTGQNGCTSTATYSIPDQISNFSVTAITSQNQSCVNANGSITIDITPFGSYQFSWSNGDTTQSLQNINGGEYTLTVSDQSGCSSIQTFSIIDQTILPDIITNVVPATCGQSNGAIYVDVSGTSNNTFRWTTGSTNEELINLSEGTYGLTVTGDNGCMSAVSIDLPNISSSFSVTGVTADDSLCLHPSGFIHLSVIPDGLYNYLWSNGAISKDLQNLSSGIYAVTVTDQFQCSTTEWFTIENNTTLPLIAEVITRETCGSANGAIDLTVVPGSGNQFIWSTGETMEDLQNLQPGVYIVTVTDQNGCSITRDFEIPASPLVAAHLNANLASGQGGQITCELTLNRPLSEIDRIRWEPLSLLSCLGDMCMLQTFTITEPTEVSVIVIDTNGCKAEDRIVLNIHPEIKIYIPNVFSPNGDGPNDQFTIFANEEVKEVVVLEIFDRWGNKVFVNQQFPPNQANYGWDGSYEGKMMNPDVFAYRAVVLFSNGEEHAYKGDVTLVR